MTFRYIGSKARLLSALKPHLTKPTSTGRFVDLFCGTGAVAELAASQGTPVVLNDSLVCAVTMSGGRLLSEQQARFEQFGGYAEVVQQLNALPAVPGVMWKLYSPAVVITAALPIPTRRPRRSVVRDSSGSFCPSPESAFLASRRLVAR